MKSNPNKLLFKSIPNFKLTPENSVSEIVIKIFTWDSSRSYRLFFFLLIGIVVSLSLILISIGTPPINAFPTDVTILLDSGWRIINGQTPHLDYYSPLGIFNSLPIAFGMKIGSPSAYSIAYGNVLLLVLLTPWAWLIARRRFSALNAFLFALFMALLLVTPRPLGKPIEDTSYAMLYNRQGFVLLSLLLTELFVIPHNCGKPKNKFLGGLCSGILLGFLFYCKVNFFAIATLAILLYIILFRCSQAWFIGFLSGVASIFLTMYILFDLNAMAYLADISLAANGQDKIQKLHNLKKAFIDNYSWLYLIFILIIINPMGQNKSLNQSSNFGQKNKTQIIATFVALSGILICGTNAQDTDIPIFFVAGLILLEPIRREFKLNNYSGNSFFRLKYFLTIAIVTLFCLTILLQDLGSITSAVMSNNLKLNPIVQSQQLQSKTMSNLLVVEKSSDYPPMINDGLSLLRPHISKDSRVLALDFANPFSFSLELSPPKGDALWWHYNHNFNEESFPQPEKVFQEVNLVIIPKESDQGSRASEHMQEIYGEFLYQNFQEKDSSQFWTLWTKL